ncbi:MAG: metallopeptidase family protein [Candidatus Brocadiae bacterium]|nr:metallopeptidase family protein [Candidatus Brocadiia bacterium]
MRRQEFELLVEKAIAALPPEFRERLDNVVIQVADRPTPEQRREVGLGPDEDLFGLYEGRPLTVRDTNDPQVRFPDRIWIFQGPIEQACDTRGQIVREIQDTVVHEIGHFFGLDEDEIGAIEAEYEYDDGEDRG